MITPSGRFAAIRGDFCLLGYEMLSGGESQYIANGIYREDSLLSKETDMRKRSALKASGEVTVPESLLLTFVPLLAMLTADAVWLLK